MDQIKLVTANGIKGKDDCIDTISMLIYMNPWKPNASINPHRNSDNIYEFDSYEDDFNNYGSYIV